jgi:hypothetical protein
MLGRICAAGRPACDHQLRPHLAYSLASSSARCRPSAALDVCRARWARRRRATRRRRAIARPTAWRPTSSETQVGVRPRLERARSVAVRHHIRRRPPSAPECRPAEAVVGLSREAVLAWLRENDEARWSRSGERPTRRATATSATRAPARPGRDLQLLRARLHLLWHPRPEPRPRALPHAGRGHRRLRPQGARVRLRHPRHAVGRGLRHRDRVAR